MGVTINEEKVEVIVSHHFGIMGDVEMICSLYRTGSFGHVEATRERGVGGCMMRWCLENKKGITTRDDEGVEG